MQQGERAWLILSSEYDIYTSMYVCWQKKKRSSKTKIMLMHSLSWPANTNTFTNLQNYSNAWTDTARKGPWAHLFSWSCMHDCANNFKLWLYSGSLPKMRTASKFRVFGRSGTAAHVRTCIVVRTYVRTYVCSCDASWQLCPSMLNSELSPWRKGASLTARW